LRALFILGLAILATGMLYAPELEHPFLWDDNVQIAENPAVTDGVPWTRYFLDRDTTSTRKDYNTRIYRPLRNLALRALWRFGDRSPAHHAYVFHLASLVLYLLGGVLDAWRRTRSQPRSAPVCGCSCRCTPRTSSTPLRSATFCRWCSSWAGSCARCVRSTSPRVVAASSSRPCCSSRSRSS
jgi:hypothetical protein